MINLSPFPWQNMTGETLRCYLASTAPVEEIHFIMPEGWEDKAKWIGVDTSAWTREHCAVCIAKARAIWADAMLAELSKNLTGQSGYDIQRLKIVTQVGTTTYPYNGGILNEMNDAVLRAKEPPTLHNPEPPDPLKNTSNQG